MNEMLGIAPKKQRTGGKLDEMDINYILQKGNTTRSTADAERIAGLGKEPHKSHEHIEKISSIQKEIIELKNKQSGNNDIIDNSFTSIQVVNHKKEDRHKHKHHKSHHHEK